LKIKIVLAVFKLLVSIQVTILNQSANFEKKIDFT